MHDAAGEAQVVVQEYHCETQSVRDAANEAHVEVQEYRYETQGLQKYRCDAQGVCATPLVKP